MINHNKYYYERKNTGNRTKIKQKSGTKKRVAVLIQQPLVIYSDD